MFRIDSDGATNDNKFTEGNPVQSIPATVVSADWLNDTVQEELCRVVEYAGLTLDKQDNTQLLAALRILIEQNLITMPLGKIEILDQYAAPSAVNPRLSLLADQEITTSNWSLLVPYLRGKKITYLPGTGSEKSAFDITSYTRATNSVTVTFANATAENKILAALAEDNLVNGSFTNWMTITVPLFADVPAGTYAITALDTVNRTISFNQTGANVTNSVTTTGEFYLHRVADSEPSPTTKARVRAVNARSLISINDSDSEVIGGLRRRDRFQKWQLGGTVSSTYYGYLIGEQSASSAGTQNNNGYPAFVTSGQGNSAMITALSDGTNGTPRTGKTTDPRGFGIYLCMWGGTYTP